MYNDIIVYMNWITTNIRLPEDLYMDLKMRAAKQRKSVAELIREKLTRKSDAQQEDRMHLLEKMQILAKKIAKENKGVNFTKGLIQMRYEQ